ncbi:MAG: hypothetical protein KJ721_02165 [Nanoarchaeota archaeon]|nr:hypothetical protein [Nanoarchaeota archaeon]
MKIEVNIEKRYTYAIFGVLFLALGIFIVNAYGTSNPAVVGHSAGEIVEADPTVLASVKDGVSWSEISSIPAGFADGVDDGASSIAWSSITGKPAGFADGVDDVGSETPHGLYGWCEQGSSPGNYGCTALSPAYCSGPWNRACTCPSGGYTMKLTGQVSVFSLESSTIMTNYYSCYKN